LRPPVSRLSVQLPIAYVLYCLRHTYCTDLQRAGVPLNIAKYLMGHNDISVTANIYTHTTDDDINSAAKKINESNKHKTAHK
jgi:site-specific recombinase XerD